MSIKTFKKNKFETVWGIRKYMGEAPIREEDEQSESR